MPRSRSRFGSNKATIALAGNKSGNKCSVGESHGSHDSMPSKVWPSANRSHCSEPHGSVRNNSAARSRTSSVASSSRTGKNRASSTEMVER